MKLARELTAEFIGTFALCFGGVLACKHFAGDPGELMGVAIAHGFIITAFASATLAISGAQFNPAVTFALFLTQKIEFKRAMSYVAVQCLAGLAAGDLLLVLVDKGTIAAGTPAFDVETVSIGQAFLAEAVATFFLVFVIFGAVVDKRPPRVGGLYIGMAVSLGIFAVGPITGAAMNPARHLGTALIGGDMIQVGQTWLYWLAPLTGGGLAGVFYHYFLGKSKD